MAFIYGLYDPRFPLYLENVRYIGRTILLLKERLSGHLADAADPSPTRDVEMWTANLLECGIRPAILPLEICAEEDVGERERAWIAEGRCQGWNLLNEYEGSRYTKRRPTRRKSIADRLWAKVDVRGPDECWPWIAYVHSKSRPMLGVGSREAGDARKVPAARVAWELANGRCIPDGLWALHTCDNGLCCNPNHIYVGTQVDNMRDCSERGRQRNQNSDSTHCKRGHLFDEENTLITRDGKRVCRQCRRDRTAAMNAEEDQRRADAGLSPIKRRSRKTGWRPSQETRDKMADVQNERWAREKQEQE